MTRYALISIIIVLARCTYQLKDENHRIEPETKAKSEMRSFCDTLIDKVTVCYFKEQENFDWIFSAHRNGSILLVDTLGNIGAIDQQIDFNQDNYLDIIVYEMGGNGRFYLYLWNKSKSKFEAIKNYNYCINSKKMNSAQNCYFSYDWAGCCIQHSYLYTLENYRIQPIAHLSITTNYSDSLQRIQLSKCSLFGWENDSLIDTWESKLSIDNEALVEQLWKEKYLSLIN